MKAIEVGLRNPYLVIVLVLAVAVIGITAMTRIPADLLPQFNTPAVQIVTFYPGMPPEVMERDIMSRLQRWTGQSIGISHQEAKAMLGVCIVKDFFREGISFDTAMSQVTSYAMSDMFYLPPGTIPPMVMPFDPTASVPLCLVSVSSPTMSEKDLYDVAYRELRNRLQSISGVIAPAVYGGVLRRILAYVDPMELEARSLSPMDVVNAIQKQSVFIPTGNAKFGDIDYQIVSNAMPEQVEQLNDIPIKTESGAVVFIRDIGEVKDSNQIQSNIVNINGRRQAAGVHSDLSPARGQHDRDHRCHQGQVDRDPFALARDGPAGQGHGSRGRDGPVRLRKEEHHRPADCRRSGRPLGRSGGLPVSA